MNDAKSMHKQIISTSDKSVPLSGGQHCTTCAMSRLCRSRPLSQQLFSTATTGEIWQICQKGILHNFLLLLKSHILCCNQVWYSWFCLEGSSVAPKTHFWGFLRAAHMGPHLTDFDSQRPAPRLARFDYRNSFLTKPFWNEINLDVTYSLSPKNC